MLSTLITGFVSGWAMVRAGFQSITFYLTKTPVVSWEATKQRERRGFNENSTDKKTKCENKLLIYCNTACI